MRRCFPILLVVLAACDVTPVVPAPGPVPTVAPTGGGAVSPSEAMTAQDFSSVVARVKPVAESECRNRTSGVNCDFLIQVDRRRRLPANAYQSETDEGRPVITFTARMVESVRTQDELAFILGHEAAHHIAGHLAQQARNAAEGADTFADLAARTGTDIKQGQQLGELVGAWNYSKEFELEADELSTLITYRSGYDPLLGAQYFTQVSDPGDQFLSTHPPNAARIDTVRRTARALGLNPG